MPKYQVPIYFRCTVEVEADNAAEAKAAAGNDDTEFNVEAYFVSHPGGPAVDFMNVGTPLLIEENEDA